MSAPPFIGRGYTRSLSPSHSPRDVGDIGGGELLGIVFCGLVFVAIAGSLAYLSYKFSIGDEVNLCGLIISKGDPEKKIALFHDVKKKAVPLTGPATRRAHKPADVPVGRSSSGIVTLPLCQDLEFSMKADLKVPGYWKVKTQSASTPTCTRHQITEANLASVQALMDGTWADIETRDRKEKGIKKFQVVQALRIENFMLWRKYSEYRDSIESTCQQNPNFKDVHVQTHALAEEHKDVDRILRKMKMHAGANEFLLFHGTRPTAAAAICENGFHVDLAGSNVGAMYGPGVYLAERSSKADEYAQDDQDGPYQGLYAMLLCRATCGVMKVSEEKTPKVSSLFQAVMQDGTYHSVLGDREKASGTYREFVCYDSGQTYPEFLIIYRRYTQRTE